MGGFIQKWWGLWRKLRWDRGGIATPNVKKSFFKLVQGPKLGPSCTRFPNLSISQFLIKFRDKADTRVST